jgi:hypothetical protein|tara:strand:+ start:493 stop:705 length:213 start_codon:yes stop_codon:yes gene_type:complete
LQVVEVAEHIVLLQTQQVVQVVAVVVLQRPLELSTLAEVDLPLIQVLVLVVMAVLVLFSSLTQPNKYLKT